MALFRRSFRLKITPLVVIGAVLMSIWEAKLIIPAVAVVAYWLAAAVGQFSKRLELTDSEVKMYGYLGGPIAIKKDELVSCRYVRAQPIARGAIDMFFIELRGSGGQGIRIWRYGWGRQQRRKLGRALNDWLQSTGVSIDDQVARILEKMS